MNFLVKFWCGDCDEICFILRRDEKDYTAIRSHTTHRNEIQGHWGTMQLFFLRRFDYYKKGKHRGKRD